jgi:hypothetical protein
MSVRDGVSLFVGERCLNEMREEEAMGRIRVVWTLAWAVSC